MAAQSDFVRIDSLKALRWQRDAEQGRLGVHHSQRAYLSEALDLIVDYFSNLVGDAVQDIFIGSHREKSAAGFPLLC